MPGAPDHFARSYYDHAATLRERCGPFVGDEKRCDFDLEVSGTSYAVSLRIGWDVVLSLCPAGERFKCIVLAFVGAGVSAEEAARRKQALEGLLAKAPVGGLRVLGQDQRRLISEQKRDGLHFGSLGSDRFGRPYARKTTQDPNPGPGAYGNHTMDTRPRALASSSAFLSETKRGIEAQLGGGGGKPPGPAFYRPRHKMKKSFMLNAARKWV